MNPILELAKARIAAVAECTIATKQALAAQERVGKTFPLTASRVEELLQAVKSVVTFVKILEAEIGPAKDSSIGQELLVALKTSVEIGKKYNLSLPSIKPDTSVPEVVRQICDTVNILCQKISGDAGVVAGAKEIMKERDQTTTNQEAALRIEQEKHRETSKRNITLTAQHKALHDKNGETIKANERLRGINGDLQTQLENSDADNKRLHESIESLKQSLEGLQKLLLISDAESQILREENVTLKRQSGKLLVANFLEALQNPPSISAYLQNLSEDERARLRFAVFASPAALTEASCAAGSLVELRDQKPLDEMLNFFKIGFEETESWGRLQYIDSSVRVFLVQRFSPRHHDTVVRILLEEFANSPTPEPAAGEELETLLADDSVTSHGRRFIIDTALQDTRTVEIALLAAVGSSTFKVQINSLPAAASAKTFTEETIASTLENIRQQSPEIFEAVLQLVLPLTRISLQLRLELSNRLLQREVDQDGFDSVLDTYPYFFAALIRSSDLIISLDRGHLSSIAN